MRRTGPTASQKRAASAFPVEPVTPEAAVKCEWVLAIDPGTVNCGMALFLRDTDQPSGWAISRAWKEEPFGCLDVVRDCVEWDDGVVVMESYMLYPDMLQQQGFSRLGTVEVIGAVRWYVLAQQTPSLAVVMQQASIKEAGCRRLYGACVREKGKGMKHDPSVHQGPNIHARDAEAHGVYWTQVKWPDLAGIEAGD